MTQTAETLQAEGPEGSIFLPSDRELTLPELDKLKFAVMQLRGAASELTPEEQMRAHKEIVAAEEAIRAKDSRLGGVALSLVV